MPGKVVVTGLGAITPLGANASELWENVVVGTSGVHTLTDDWVEEYDLPVKFAAKAKIQPIDILPRVEAKRLDPYARHGIIAAREAFVDAGFSREDGAADNPKNNIDPDRFSVTYGTGIGGVWTLLNAWDALKTGGARKVMPLTVPLLMPNSAAAAISLDLRARAGAQTVVSACASATEAIGQAFEIIKQGRADVVITGGAEAAIHPITIAAFASMRALSKRNDNPEAASRPYDVDRDGFVMGEGAGALILESEEHAKARGAHIYAELAGNGTTADAHHITAPDPEGLGARRALEAAIANSDVAKKDIVHVNAHATSTPVGDKPEYTALHAVFGDGLLDGLLVSATKSQMGHLLGAAGAVEGILTVKAIAERKAPVTINLDNQDPEIPLNIVKGTAAALPAGDIAAINNSFGFGGHNAVALFKSYG